MLCHAATQTNRRLGASGKRESRVDKATGPSIRAKGRTQTEMDPHAKGNVMVLGSRNIEPIRFGELRWVTVGCPSITET